MYTPKIFVIGGGGGGGGGGEGPLYYGLDIPFTVGKTDNQYYMHAESQTYSRDNVIYMYMCIISIRSHKN